MRLHMKRLLLGAAGFGLVVAVLTLLGAGYLGAFQETSRVFEGSVPYRQIVQAIAETGPTPELGGLLRQLPHPAGWMATIITEMPAEGTYTLFSQPVIVSDPPNLTPVTATLVGGRQRAIRNSGPRIPGPNGKAYVVTMVQTMNLKLAFNFLTVTGAVLAWLALALWVFADALERTPAAPGWLFLGLLTGPLGLTVWLIARPEHSSEPKPPADQGLAEVAAARADVCPGCGADVVPGTAFCVRCGFALHPACPTCRRPVEPDWTYCGTCGATLHD